MNASVSTSRAIIDVQIYAVGGTGIDILRDVSASNTEKSLEGMEHTSLNFVDTSDSNSSSIAEDKLFRVPGLNGGGKNRKYIVEKSAPHIPALLERMKPKKVNIVAFGAGGASGAGVGPLLVGELMKRGANVVVMMVGSASGSITEILNTIATIQTLAHYTKVYRMPLPIFYRQNDSVSSLGSVDEAIRSALHAFCALFSNLNHGIEETDIKHFLNYTKTLRGASIEPTLVNLDYFPGDVIDIPDHVQVLSQATLNDPTRNRENSFDTAYEGVVYRATGDLSQNLINKRNMTPLNYLLMRGDMAVRLNELNRTLIQLEQDQAQRSEQAQDIHVPMDGADGENMFY